MMVKAKIVDHVGMQQQFLSLWMIKINCGRSAIVYGGRERSLFVNREDDEVPSQDSEVTIINLADYHFWTGLQLIPNRN